MLYKQGVVHSRFCTNEVAPPTHLLVEIERAAVVKQSDLLNKVRLMEADGPIRMFVARLRVRTYACNLSTKCPSQPCTASIVNAN